MTQTSKPSNQQVRDYMAKRREAATPPPTPERIREQLGWQMLKDEREAQRPR